jgi:hypothetical protein
MLTLSLHRCTVSVLLLLSLACTGCLAPLPVESPLPSGLTLAPIATRLVPQSPVAVSADGALLALVQSDGLFLRPLNDNVAKKLSTDLPIALAFNPHGTELAAAFVVADGSRLRRYATNNGEVLGEISFTGRCDALLNREGEWLIFVTTMEVFRFGGNLNSRLLRWDGERAPAESLLNNMTLYHPILAERGDLSATLSPQLSPHGDEILFLRLHDPPAFNPYFAVVLRHLETGSERLVAKLPQLRVRGAAIYLEGGDLVAYGDGINLVRIVEPWSETEHQRLSLPGYQLAAPFSGEMFWVDATLLQRDGQMLLNFAPQTQPVRFLPGGRLLLRDPERLWLLSGLPVMPSEPPEQDAEQLRLLRKWRADGLINVREYTERVGK